VGVAAQEDFIGQIWAHVREESVKKTRQEINIKNLKIAKNSLQ
jgi:hypothetical protein